MSDAPSDLDSAVTLAMLRLFPPAIRDAALADPEFRSKHGFKIDATLSFEPMGVSVMRSKLFAAIRRLLADPATHSNGLGIEESNCRVELDQVDGRRKILLRTPGGVAELSNYECLTPNSTERIAWFDREAKAVGLDESTAQFWQPLLASRAIEDDEVESLLSEFELTPVRVAESIGRELKDSELRLSVLVPDRSRYYERLVGAHSGGAGLVDFATTTARAHVGHLLQQAPLHGLQHAMLVASNFIMTEAVLANAQALARTVLLEFFTWLENNGDRVSQVGGIELGFALLAHSPELEDTLIRLIQTFLKDDPGAKDGRLSLTSHLIVLVEGELARTGVLRDRPPFWRRLAAIAQASLIERQILGSGVSPALFVEWALRHSGQRFFLQTMVDLRLEPRWLPDFVSPQQLRAEFLSRIGSAAHRNAEKITSPDLRATAIDDLQVHLKFPYAFLPGPLEGAVRSGAQLPADAEQQFRESLEQDFLTPKSFAVLINCAPVFPLDPALAQVAVEALRRAKHQLRGVGADAETFSLLTGLAIVAAVTRSEDLADDVRILTRILRQRSGVEISLADTVRIALISAASREDQVKWCDFVGEWLTELAFGDIGREDASWLRHCGLELCHAEPRLWDSFARAEAACTALAAA
jgi:hypothetical protein